MDLRGLRYFVAAVDSGSITGAAERCYVAQPSITQAISKLEDELGVRLLTRGKRGVEPTLDGQALYARALPLLGQSAAIIEHFRHRAPRERLYVRQEIVLPIQRMRVLLERLKPLLPDYEIHFGRSMEQADLTLCRPESAPAGHAFISLWEDEYCLLVPWGHALSGDPSPSLSCLNGLNVIERSFCEMQSEWERFLSVHQLNPTVVARCDDEDLALLMVESGVGAMLAPLGEDLRCGRNLVSIPLSHIQGAPSIHRQVGVAISPLFSGRASVAALFNR